MLKPMQQKMMQKNAEVKLNNTPRTKPPCLHTRRAVFFVWKIELCYNSDKNEGYDAIGIEIFVLFLSRMYCDTRVGDTLFQKVSFLVIEKCCIQ